MQTKKSKAQSRMGKHRPDKVRVQAYITARKKAVFVVALKVLNKTMTDMILEGGNTCARFAGVITQTGEIADKYKDAVDIAEQIIIAKEIKKNEH